MIHLFNRHLKVPEPKVVKNRLRIDLKVGGRDEPQDIRWPRVTETVQRLLQAGAAIVREDVMSGDPQPRRNDYPERNEFCVV
jgi:hypothetical protein